MLDAMAQSFRHAHTRFACFVCHRHISLAKTFGVRILSNVRAVLILDSRLVFEVALCMILRSRLLAKRSFNYNVASRSNYVRRLMIGGSLCSARAIVGKRTRSTAPRRADSRSRVILAMRVLRREHRLLFKGILIGIVSICFKKNEMRMIENCEFN